MYDKIKLDTILAEFADSGLFQSPVRPEGKGEANSAALEGDISIEGTSIHLRLELAHTFPSTLPRFILQPWNALGFLPHVDHNGVVCYSEEAGLVLDRYRLVDVIREAFKRVVAVLTAGVLGQNHSDFADEFEVYWSRLGKIQSVACFIEPTTTVMNIVAFFNAKGRLTGIAKNRDAITAYLNGREVNQELKTSSGIFIPLEPSRHIVPPHPDDSFLTCVDIRTAFWSSISEQNSVLLRRMLHRKMNSREFVVFSLPRPSGGSALFGVRYDGVGTKHPMLEEGTAKEVFPLVVQHRTPRYLVARGGGNTNLGAKRILVAGCGAVGSRVAVALAQSGIVQLSLLDNDILSPDNTYRHVLGRSSWGKAKVVALKEEIEEKLPYVHVRAVESSLETAVSKKHISVSDYDLLVFALGNPTVELMMNAYIRSLPKRSPAVFTWLEPFGIGGHALLSRNDNTHGCFECLYTSSDPTETALIENRASFAALGQRYTRSLTGCSSIFTPYGDLDAIQTATLAVRLCLDTLLGKETGNPLLSWKGDASAFDAAGFRRAKRYDLSDDMLKQMRYSYPASHCRICGTRTI